MFTKHQIDLEQVAAQLQASVASASGMATDPLLPQAHRIITRDVAKKLDAKCPFFVEEENSNLGGTDRNQQS